jgi:hypothetical protein
MERIAGAFLHHQEVLEPTGKGGRTSEAPPQHAHTQRVLGRRLLVLGWREGKVTWRACGRRRRHRALRHHGCIQLHAPSPHPDKEP